MPMPTITLRTADLADKEAVIDLIQLLNIYEADITGDRLRDRAAAEAYYAELQARIAKHQGRILLAEVEGVIAGLMGFALDEDDAYVVEDLRVRGIVTDLIVQEQWRGRGIGQMLLTEAERLTREKGLKRLLIGVLVGNDGAERTYRAFGFKPYVSMLVKEV
jgi:GNAT superfamily N-acetyltransferase